MRALLADIRQLISAHEQVLQDTVSVRFEDIEDANAILRVDAGIDTTNYQTFLSVAEDLNLGLLDIIERAGARFTGPAQLHQEPLKPAVRSEGKTQ
jgi:MscS family membrane protein